MEGKHEYGDRARHGDRKGRHDNCTLGIARFNVPKLLTLMQLETYTSCAVTSFYVK